MSSRLGFVLAACAAFVLALSAASPADAAVGVVHSFGSGPGAGQLFGPRDVAVGADGSIYVAESGNSVSNPDNNRVQKFSSTGAFLTKWGSLAQFNTPVGIATSGSNVYVVDAINRVVQRFDTSGVFQGTIGQPGSGFGQIGNPSGIAADAAGNVYISDAANHKVLRFDPSGSSVLQIGFTQGSGDGQFSKPSDVAVDAAGNTYVADAGNYRIQKLNASGAFVSKWGSRGAGDGQLGDSPELAVDAAGTVLYVTEPYNHRVQVFGSNGAFRGKFGGFGECEGQFSFPGGSAVDTAGRLYIADSGNDRVQVFGQGGAPVPRCAGSRPQVPRATPTTPAPSISALSLTRRTFCVGRRCPPRNRGTTVRFRLSQPAFVEATIARRLNGRRLGARCRHSTRRNRRGRRCALYVSAGSFSRVSGAGNNRIAFSGRLGGRALRPGSYRISLRATGGSGARSALKRLPFRVRPIRAGAGREGRRGR